MKQWYALYVFLYPYCNEGMKTDTYGAHFVVTDGTARCCFYNLGCRQWRQSSHYDNSRFSTDFHRFIQISILKDENWYPQHLVLHDWNPRNNSHLCKGRLLDFITFSCLIHP